MNLRNKKTGGKGYLYANKDANYNVLDADDKVLAVYPSLAELSEDWEDYEEPKKYWYIGDRGEIFPEIVENPGHIWHQARKEIGNYFETREEAEKAVQKLKAWKRLKDIGCSFVLDDNFTVKFVGPTATKLMTAEEGKMLYDDYILLFGGEE